LGVAEEVGGVVEEVLAVAGEVVLEVVVHLVAGNIYIIIQ
jgi:hypothetical protein